MTATSAPFGMRPAFDKAGDALNVRRYSIASAYGTAIYRGMPVILNTNGTVVAGTAAADILGVFWGCEYTDSTGKPNESPFWPAAQATLAGTPIYAYVYDSPGTVFEIQADGAVPQTAIGDQADFTSVGTGSTLTGLSTATVSASLAGAGVQAQLRIVGFGLGVDNTVGDAFTVVQVEIARHQFVASKTAI
jgi:hypothetical protein